MVNAHFEDFKVLQYNQPGIVFDKENEKTSIESWEKPDDQLKESIQKYQGLHFTTKNPYYVFKAGSIINSAADLPVNQNLTFFMFKVVIGRAFCNRPGKPLPPHCPEGYDSVYLETNSKDSFSSFTHSYAIYNFERVQLIH